MRKASVFRFLRFEERFRKAPFSWRISAHGRPNSRNKPPFSNSSGVMWTGPWCITYMYFNVNTVTFVRYFRLTVIINVYVPVLFGVKIKNCLTRWNLPLASLLATVNVASSERVLPSEFLAMQRYVVRFFVVSLKTMTSEEILSFWDTVPLVTGVLFFNQPITGRGEPLALQNSVTVAMPSSMNSRALFGWIEKVGLQKTEI